MVSLLVGVDHNILRDLFGHSFLLVPGSLQQSADRERDLLLLGVDVQDLGIHDLTNLQDEMLRLNRESNMIWYVQVQDMMRPRRK